jgi:hypothetical protein
VTPDQAAVFYEEDEDPAAVFAWFDGQPPDPVTGPAGGATVER